MNAATTPPDRKYAVFISYRHADNKEQGRQWATWLHHTLETYEVPPDLVGRTNLRGEPVPASLYPVFRDEEELPADADLSANIQRALRHSALLVVLCSPRAVESRFVADEIKVFKELGKAGHILALMIDGEPNATDDPGKARAGISPEHECLPEPLRYGVPRGDGSIDWMQRTEPIAADVRPENKPVQGWTTAAAYREELTRQGLAKPEIERLSTAYEEQLQLATMKIIAGAIGLPLGEVTQRDKRHAEKKLKRARQELSRTEFLFARQLLDLAKLEEGTARLELRAKAYARLSRSQQSDPGNKAAMILGLDQIRRFSNRGALRGFPGSTAALSPRGSLVITWSGNEVTLLDASTGRPLTEPLRHEHTVNSAVFSPDGERILTACGDYRKPGFARLWDAFTGFPVGKPLRHADRVNSAVFSPDGTRVLTVGDDCAARLWDAATGDLLVAPFLNEFPARCCSFCLDGTRILWVSGGKIAQPWDCSTGVSLHPIRHGDWALSSAVFSPDGLRILTSAHDGTARLWDVATGKTLTEPLLHKHTVCSALFSPDGTRVLTASSDNTARLWDAATGRPLTQTLDHEDRVNTAVFSPDGTRILTASSDNTARLWDAVSGETLAEPFRHGHGVDSAAFSSDGARILTVSDCGLARLWDAAGCIPLAATIRFKAAVNSAVFSPDGASILIASADGTAQLRDAATGNPVRPPFRCKGSVNSAVFSPDGARVLTASGDLYVAGSTRLWDIATGTPLATSCQKGWAAAAVFSPDGTKILTAASDGSGLLWNADMDTLLTKRLHHDNRVRAAVFSSDGRRILTVAEGKTTRLWDAATGDPLADPYHYESEVNSAVFSPDDARILVALDDRSAQLLNVGSGERLAEPLRHENAVNSAVFSPDGEQILTACGDYSKPGFVRLWDTSTGCPLTEPLRHEDMVRSAIFNPDGTQVLAVSNDNTARLWDAPTWGLLAHDSKWLNLLLEASGGCRLNERDLLKSVPPDELAALRREFDAATDMDRLLSWWWSDPFTRTINPSSAITVPDYVRRRIREILDLEDEKAKPRCLLDARDAFMNHPLVLLCEAEQGKCSDPAWLMQHAVSRLLAEPHYLTPLEPPNAIGDAKANRQYELTLGLAEDSFLGARLLINDRAGQTRTTDPKRIELAKQVLARAMKLAPENEAYRKLAAEL